MMDDSVLTNPFYVALTTRQADLAVAAASDGGATLAVRFHPEVNVFAALAREDSACYDALATLVPVGKTIAVELQRALTPAEGWEPVFVMPVLRMVQTEDAVLQASPDGVDTVPLGAADVGEMIALTELTKPGPFVARTIEMGAYYGIRRDGKLAAMAGERSRVPGYTEVSAVCTHPDHTGKGYAAALMSKVIAGIRERGEVPFLHVRSDNTGAIALYNKLGFRTWAEMQIHVLRKL